MFFKKIGVFPYIFQAFIRMKKAVLIFTLGIFMSFSANLEAVAGGYLIKNTFRCGKYFGSISRMDYLTMLRLKIYNIANKSTNIPVIFEADSELLFFDSDKMYEDVIEPVKKVEKTTDIDGYVEIWGSAGPIRLTINGTKCQTPLTLQD